MNDYEVKCDAILAWANKIQFSFDTEFVESIQNQLYEGRELSGAQMDAIDNIIDGFRIEY
jgi:hypothetical protein